MSEIFRHHLIARLASTIGPCEIYKWYLLKSWPYWFHFCEHGFIHAIFRSWPQWGRNVFLCGLKDDTKSEIPLLFGKKSSSVQIQRMTQRFKHRVCCMTDRCASKVLFPRKTHISFKLMAWVSGHLLTVGIYWLQYHVLPGRNVFLHLPCKWFSSRTGTGQLQPSFNGVIDWAFTSRIVELFKEISSFHSYESTTDALISSRKPACFRRSFDNWLSHCCRNPSLFARVKGLWMLWWRSVQF